jgi:uncharacterized protein
MSELDAAPTSALSVTTPETHEQSEYDRLITENSEAAPRTLPGDDIVWARIHTNRWWRRRHTRVLCLVAVLLSIVAAVTVTVLARSHSDSSGGDPSVPLPHVRPPPAQRKFNSTVINNAISSISSKMKDADLATLFSNTLPNTLDTTVQHFSVDQNGVPDTFIITGDITAQWLRDSTNQVLPYIPYTTQDPQLKLLICGLIHRQARDILHDPYANAFNYAQEGGPHQGDIRKPPMTKHVFEGKYELDSLAAALKLAFHYYNATSDLSCFDSTWQKSVETIIDTIVTQQNGTEEEGDAPPYMFERLTYVATDTLMLSGRGAPAQRTGMSKCGFRPSDDSITLPFLIPANAMAVVELGHVATVLLAINTPSSQQLAMRATALAKEIDQGIQQFAISNGHFMYEVDGYGSAYMMDDANIPSLLSLPYLGYISNTAPEYLKTRSLLLSRANPYYFVGSVAKGIGGPHEGIGYIWPMALIVQALTSTDDSEILQLLETLKASSAGTGFLHESFWKSDYATFTRPWFAWCNSLFGELILRLASERPHLIF